MISMLQCNAMLIYAETKAAARCVTILHICRTCPGHCFICIVLLNTERVFRRTSFQVKLKQTCVRGLNKMIHGVNLVSCCCSGLFVFLHNPGTLEIRKLHRQNRVASSTSKHSV